MKKQEFESFTVAGVAIRTTNENQQAMQDIPQLWGRFMSEGVTAQLESRQGDAIYCVYTEYESDHTKPYTVIIGHRVSSQEMVPEGMHSCLIQGGTYAQFVAKGNLKGEALPKAWHTIWESGIDRSYTTDFEYYDERAQNPEDGEADVFIATRKNS